MVRMISTMVTEKFEGRSINIELANGESIEGVLEQVTSYELGVRAPSGALIVFRHAVKSVRVRENEVMGIVKECCEERYILGNDYIGYDVVVKFIDGKELSGKLISVSRYEIAVASDGYAYILNKGLISYVRLLG
ncbi:MAG: hypothetical protein RQ885_12745 [Desulfurococcales archaeon]|jgi:sRNA-binding regulator protein Hfq|nr:hypothetical protein [Desulfurococcales archaeon]